jgi:hypothetical protein
VDLGSVPDRYWDEIADLGFDAAWHGWCWDGGGRWLVVVNLSDNMAAGLVHAPWEDLGRRTWS